MDNPDNLKRRAYTHFIEGPHDTPANLTFHQAPLDPTGGQGDRPGGAGGNTTFFNPNLTPSNPAAPVEADLIKAIRQTMTHEEIQRTPMMEGADKAWNLYHNRYNFAGKEPWQSQKVAPKVFTAVERIIATVLRIKEKSREWFDVEALTEQNQIYYNLVKHLLRFYLDHDEVGLDRELRNSCKAGLLSHMMYMLVVWETDGQIEVESTIGGGSDRSTGDAEKFGPLLNLSGEDPGGTGKPTMPGRTQSRLRIQALNPDYVYLDSTGRNRYKMWKVIYDKGEAIKEGTTRGWDMVALRESMNSPGTPVGGPDSSVSFHTTRDAEKQDKQLDYTPASKVEILNFFGDLYDRTTGHLIAEDVYLILANNSRIVYGPVPNPFLDGEDPVIAAPFTEVPFSAYGRSPLVQNLDMFESWTEFYNLLMDYFQSVLLGIKEIDMDQVEEFNQNLDSLQPAQVIQKRGQGAAGPAISNVAFSDIPPGLFQFIPTIQKEISDNIMLSDTIGGASRSRGRITAMEDSRRSADAGAMIEFIFSAIQDNLLAPVIRKSFYRILQFMPQSMWQDWVETHAEQIKPKDPNQQEEWAQIYEKMKTWSAKDRWDNLAGLFKFKVRIFSALGDKQAEIEKATFFMQSVSSVPNIASLINWPRFLRKLAVGFDWDPEEILDLSQIPTPAKSTPQGENYSLDAQQLQPSSTDGNIEPGPSLGAPTSISTNPPYIPGNTDGVPGRMKGAK